MPVTQFWDMCSGGYQKESFEMCYIEAPQDDAVKIFESRFGHSPYSIACKCCGDNYSVSEYATLLEVAKHHLRGRTLDEYLKDPGVLFISKSDISERKK